MYHVNKLKASVAMHEPMRNIPGPAMLEQAAMHWLSTLPQVLIGLGSWAT